ncbi:AAA-like domain-containing protein [Phormidium sp. FACHB-592]|uniref:AAA-like domain-containing protein n=1 Tax=Stenomitos frigidus AS-A4 TaxID=2933935 RepID=A0ABV0KMH4_9CYAN|nr:AAA-like domain-containing protein [Phormidium sp. FACHB-592]MBD2077080.1 AAA-like domain-containing protein [Phormidium sp. FACHB-592]
MSQNRRSRSVQATAAGVESLEARRVDENWTRQTLANRAGVSLDTLERLIKRKNVDRDSVRRLVAALELQPTDIIDPDVWEPLIDPQPYEAVINEKILMSYHNSNFDVAQQLCSQLQAVGQTVFMAGEAVRKSTHWFQQFTDALDRCHCYVLLLSSQAAMSEMMAEEVRQVRERYNTQKQPQIVPIHVGQMAPINSDLSDYLTGLQTWEWRSPTDVPAIVEAIQNPPAEKDLPVILLSDSLALEPELPVGQVPLESTFYIERPPIEAQCYQEIVHPGALIRIKAPRQMGKTSLMARMLDQARKQGYRAVHLSFQLAPSNVLSNVDKLMRWFCLCVSRSLSLPNQLADYWDDIFDGNYNSTSYFEQYLLVATNSPLVIGLDEVDRVFAYPEIANDFFGLLRAWYEKAKYGDRDSDTWKKLRLIVIHSTEVYIPMNLNQSPFNVGLSIELPEFTIEQVQDLTQRYHLDWTLDQIKALMRLVGGHPYLVRVAMYHVAHQAIAFEQVLEQAPTEAGVYSDHLRRHLWNLEQYPELANAFSDVVIAKVPITLRPILAFKLRSLGLVTIVNNHVTPRCELYQQYFSQHLVMDEIE